MKILTLNTHSLQEENYADKLNRFVEGMKGVLTYQGRYFVSFDEHK